MTASGAGCRLLVIVNHPAGLKPDQSTAALVRAARLRGHDVALAGIADLALTEDDRVTARVRRVPAPTGVHPEGPKALARMLAVTLAATPTTWTLGAGLVVLVRTNPARPGEPPWAHQTGLQLLARARDAGAIVRADPDGLLRATSKLYLSTLPPRWRPATIVSRDPAALTAFVRSRPDRAVLKPLQGTQGDGVYLIDATAPQNLAQIVESLTRQGFCIAQDFIPEAADGDTRLLLLDGALLEAGGQPAVVRRVPATGEFRSNVAQGGHPAPAVLTPTHRALVEEVGPRLRADGLWLVGLDLVGDRVVEVNAYSPGGLVDAGQFQGVDFVGAVVDALVGGANPPSTPQPITPPEA